jgi:hypothetical protein
MTDINTELARVMGYITHGFKYENPDIVLENIIWFVDNGFIDIDKHDDEYNVKISYTDKMTWDFSVTDKDLALAVAKARIEASKEGE